MYIYSRSIQSFFQRGRSRRAQAKCTHTHTHTHTHAHTHIHTESIHLDSVIYISIKKDGEIERLRAREQGRDRWIDRHRESDGERGAGAHRQSDGELV